MICITNIHHDVWDVPGYVWTFDTMDDAKAMLTEYPEYCSQIYEKDDIAMTHDVATNSTIRSNNRTILYRVWRLKGYDPYAQREVV